MARTNVITYFKKLLLQFITEPDPLLAMLKWFTEQLMQMEAEAKVGVEKGKHSPSRTTYFSGYRVRRFDTRMGTLYLLIPKLRNGGYIRPYRCQHKHPNPQAGQRVPASIRRMAHPPSDVIQAGA